ncbi:stage II sporulation protein M [Agrococcus citreus]|uniref:Uncharacterized protein n=1 Tax=Agrococcus citreus TaxID=84643 RepID=A0ABN1YSY4_9MICO
MGAAGTLAPRSAGVSVALAASALVVVIGAAAASGGALGDRNAAALAGGDLDSSVLAGDRDAGAIAARNLGAIALLASGAPLLGTLTVIAVAVLGMGLGLSGAAVVEALGAAETLQRVGPYIAFELAGVLLAAAAGILPTVHAVGSALRRRAAVPFPPAYASALPSSLALTLVAATLIVIAAVIEAIVISAHPG